MIRRLFSSQKIMRDLMDHIESVADLCRKNGESGLAFAVLMIRESLASYTTALTSYTKKALEED